MAFSDVVVLVIVDACDVGTLACGVLSWLVDSRIERRVSVCNIQSGYCTVSVEVQLCEKMHCYTYTSTIRINALIHMSQCIDTRLHYGLQGTKP